MIAAIRTYAYDWADPGDSGQGMLNDTELTVLALLIDHRRCLPVCLGGAWRCYVCGHEHVDVTAMAHHILDAHGPEPLNEEDMLELAVPRRISA